MTSKSNAIRIQRHTLKTVQPYFDAVWSGTKRFELRVNDRDFQVDDMVFLKDYNQFTDEYSGREISCRISFLLKDYPGIKDGYCIFGFKVVNKTKAK